MAAAQEPAQPVSQLATDESQAATDPSMPVIIVGGIKNPSRAEFVSAPDDARTPELPVVYEEAAPVAPSKTHGPPAQDRPRA